MQPVTKAAIDDAARRWEANGAESYRMVVQVRPPRASVVRYEVHVAAGVPVRVERDGQVVASDWLRHYDYSVEGLFAMLREDLRLADVPVSENRAPVDLRGQFEPENGRLLHYRRTTGAARRRPLVIDVLEYEPRGS